MSSKHNEVLPLSVRSIDENGVELSPQNRKSGEISVEVDRQHEKTDRTVMSFHDINYTVQMAKSPCGTCRPKDEKRILTNVR